MAKYLRRRAGRIQFFPHLRTHTATAARHWLLRVVRPPLRTLLRGFWLPLPIPLSPGSLIFGSPEPENVRIFRERRTHLAWRFAGRPYCFNAAIPKRGPKIRRATR